MPDLTARQKLGLIDKDTGAGAVLQPLFDPGEQIVGGTEGVGHRADADAAGDPRFTRTGVEMGRQQISLHAAFDIIVRGLQKHGRFAGVHRGIIEVELGHGAR